MEISTATASETRDQFLQLLVTQLRHQDPLDPIKQEDFLSQLAQFSTLEGIENLNSRFDQQLAIQEETLKAQQLAQAASLVGQEITYVDGEFEGSTQRGTVESVELGDDQLRLGVGGKDVGIGQLLSVRPTSNGEEAALPVADEPEPGVVESVSQAVRRRLSARPLR